MKRNNPITIRFRSDELKEIKKNAEQIGLSVSSYIRMMTLSRIRLTFNAQTMS
jgi:predicted DNA binding CopG/RHH family protein